MLLILHGPNRFARNEFLNEFLKNKNATPEHIEGDDFDIGNLATITQGQSLFAEERITVVHDLSSNTEAWDALSDWLEKTDVDSDIILLEDKLDKRKTTTKQLIALGQVKEFNNLREGDSGAAINWLMEWSNSNDIALDRQAASEMVSRVGGNQGMLANEVRRLSVLGERVTRDMVVKYTPDKLEARVFSILEAALKGEGKYLVEELSSLRQLSDPYQFMGLLASQVFQFSAIHFSGASLSDISSGLKINTYAVQSSSRVRVDGDKVRFACDILAETDYKMKSTTYDPWGLVESSLVEIALK